MHLEYILQKTNKNILFKTGDSHFKERIWFNAWETSHGSKISFAGFDGEIKEKMKRSTHGFHRRGKGLR